MTRTISHRSHRRPNPMHVAAPRPTTEHALRDIAFVLHLTQRVAAQITAQEKAQERSPLGIGG